MEYYAKFDEATLQHLADIMKSGLCTEPITLTQNGTYVAPVGRGYTPVTVNVAGGSEITYATVGVSIDGEAKLTVVDIIETDYGKFLAPTTIEESGECRIPMYNGLAVVTCDSGGIEVISGDAEVASNTGYNTCLIRGACAIHLYEFM